MNENIIPRLSKEISIYPLNKNDFFIHQLHYDHRIKISSDLNSFIGIIDGERDLKSLVNEYNENSNLGLTTTFAYDFLYNKLAKFGIIESETIKIKPNEKPSYIKLSFIVINERIVSKLTKYLKFLFVPNVMKSILTIIVLLLFVCFYLFYDQILNTTIAKSEWLLFFFLSFIGVTFHEFGHASAAHYFGAKHGGIGGGFYLFMPVYFADVTDIWKLSKKQRIIVNLAGMYFELVYIVFLISMALLFQYSLIAILACIYSISILHSLNPFARSDGYWVLSDAIEKPNLMQQGFIRVKLIFKISKEWKAIDYFLLFYGLVSYSFILFFVYFVVIKNPNSILFFPQNLASFIERIFEDSSKFSLAELGSLFIPVLFFYLLFGFVKTVLMKMK
jgi:putative peptide zinc metalloprotease protein